jgi:hypothetical protein
VNLSKIKFGITKVFCTFEVPNTSEKVDNDCHEELSRLFLCLLVSAINYRIGGLSFIKIRSQSGLTFLQGVWRVIDSHLFCYPKCQTIMQVQIIKINGKDHYVGGVFNIQNALLAYSYFKQLTGREFVAEMLEGEIKAQIDIIQANNPNASPVLDVLRHAYEQTKPVTDKMGYTNLFYSLSDN